jgi:predicted dienelactone hydrolase
MLFVSVIKRLIRIAATVALFLVLGVAVLLGWMRLDHNRETTLPTPTGPYVIGRTTTVWSDAAETDPRAPGPGAKRELFVWIWYPAARGQASRTVDDYLPAPWRAAVEHQRGVMNFLVRDLGRVRSHSMRGGELSPQQQTYPVILMRGGAAGLVTGYTSLAEDLASHGYVVVGFDAPYRSSVVVFPDGRVIARAPRNDIDLVSGSEAEKLATQLVQAWSADMVFGVDRLERLNTSDPSGRFLGRLDMQRVGAFGHSLGGAAALQFCHDDPRCKACIDVDGIPWGSVVREGLTQPVMLLLSDHSSDPKDDEGRMADANFGSLRDRLPGDRRLEITIRGANHYMFGDDAVLRSPAIMRALRALGIVGIDGRRQLAVTEHVIDTFFEVQLNGAPASELRNRSAYPEIEYGH